MLTVVGFVVLLAVNVATLLAVLVIGVAILNRLKE